MRGRARCIANETKRELIENGGRKSSKISLTEAAALQATAVQVQALGSLRIFNQQNLYRPLAHRSRDFLVTKVEK